MLRHRARLIAALLGLPAATGAAPAPSPAISAPPQEDPAWWFCRAVGKRSVTGETVLVYVDSSSAVVRTLGRTNTPSYVFNARGVTAGDVRARFLAEARRQYPDVVAWRGACEGFTTKEVATQADKASRARDRAAFPPAEWFAVRGFVYRRG